MPIKLALYTGPDFVSSPLNYFIHLAICLRTLSKYSHAELVIDDKCYSSSFLDGGVRSKYINLTTGRWVVYDLSNIDKSYAINWYENNKHAKYDVKGILAWLIPFIEHDMSKFVCFEAVGSMLNIDNPHTLTGNSLKKFALRNKK